MISSSKNKPCTQTHTTPCPHCLPQIYVINKENEAKHVRICTYYGHWLIILVEPKRCFVSGYCPKHQTSCHSIVFCIFERPRCFKFQICHQFTYVTLFNNDDVLLFVVRWINLGLFVIRTQRDDPFACMCVCALCTLNHCCQLFIIICMQYVKC